jgi:chromate transporter
MALLGFGGVLPFAYRYLVERSRWLSDSEFAQLLGIAQLLPGPTICNLAVIVGQRFAGTGGALAALSGLLVAPFFIVIALGVAYQELATSALFARALQGMAAAAAGLILATAAKLARGMWRGDAPRASTMAGARPVASAPSPSGTLTAAINAPRAASAPERESAPAVASSVTGADGVGLASAGTVVGASMDGVAAAGLAAGVDGAKLGVADAPQAAEAAEASEATEARIARRVTQVALLAMAFVGLGVLKLGLVTVVCALAPFGFVMFAFVWRLP